MSREKQSQGQCAYCQRLVAKGGMARHLSACPQRQAIIAETDRKKGGGEKLYHLRVQDKSLSEFWLHLEMRGSSTLQDLDDYLRFIWLECCGHMSEFSVGGWGEGKISKTRRGDKVFEPGIEITHIYDFGTSSETLIKVLGMREGHPTTSRPMALMARNLMPESPCIECGQPAAWLCHECLIEEDVWGALCDQHVKTHPHEDYGEPIRLVNSPRLGMCGYDGPAEPPY